MHGPLEVLASVILVAAACYLGGFIVLFIHELGHIVAGWIVGFEVAELRLGSGKLVSASFQGSTAILLYEWPCFGWVAHRPRRFDYYRLRQFISIAGGPFASVLLAIMLVWLWNEMPDDRTPAWVRRCAFALAMVGIATAAGSLWPGTYRIYRTQVASDGLQLWHVLRSKRLDPAMIRAGELCYQAQRLWLAGKCDMALAVYRDAVADPEASRNIEFRCSIAFLLAEMNCLDEALGHARDMIAIPDKDAKKSAEVADTFASIVLYHNRNEDYAEAEQVLRTAMKSDPTLKTLGGTLGAILFERGMFEDARPLLEELYARNSGAIDRGISAAYLALLAKNDGRIQEAERYAAEAKSNLPGHRLIKRLLPERTE